MTTETQITVQQVSIMGLWMTLLVYHYHFGPKWNISTTTGCIVMKFYTGGYDPLRMNLTDIDNLLIFPLVPP